MVGDDGLPQWARSFQSTPKALSGVQVAFRRKSSQLLLVCLLGCLLTLNLVTWRRPWARPANSQSGGGDGDDGLGQVYNNTLGVRGSDSDSVGSDSDSDSVSVSVSSPALLLLSQSQPYSLLARPRPNNTDVPWLPLDQFQKVFAIGFPERTDKRDAKTLASSFTGFDIDWLPAVAFEDVSSKAAPPTWSFDKQSPGALGCWRAHMNALEHIVSNHIQTALIMEDDADWDVNLKHQLLELAWGVRALQHQHQQQKQSPPQAQAQDDSRSGSGSGTSTQTSASPFGRDWDFLWLGHCRVGPSDARQEFWVIDDDATTPPTTHRWAGWRNQHYPAEVRRNGTRVVLQATGGMCLYSYAVTYDGARKLLASLSLQSRDMAVDASISEMCRAKFDQPPPFRCYAPYPPLLSSHRAAGPQSKDSDLNSKGDKWHHAYTWDIVYSTIMNIPRLVQALGLPEEGDGNGDGNGNGNGNGGLLTVKAQWPDVDMPELSLHLDDLALTTNKSPAGPRGYLKTIAVYNETKNAAEPV